MTTTLHAGANRKEPLMARIYQAETMGEADLRVALSAIEDARICW